MFRIKASDAIMLINVAPGYEEKITEEQLEKEIAMYICFYVMAHNGIPPSTKEVQSHINLIYEDLKEK